MPLERNDPPIVDEGQRRCSVLVVEASTDRA